MRARFIGRSILTGYYGLTLAPGEEFAVPDHLRHKVANTPALFDVLAAAAPGWPVDEDGRPLGVTVDVSENRQSEAAAALPKRRRGRPRKAG